MKVVFRADASLEMGTGHIMRCLTLATALRERGAECCFVCREHPGNFIANIVARGFEVCSLPWEEPIRQTKHAPSFVQPTHVAWLGTDWRTDADLTQTALDDLVIDWLVVDHYALDVNWERALRSMCRRIMVIDDLADRPHDCDLLLDQNLGRNAEDYRDLISEKSALLIGPLFALLRPEFAAIRNYSLSRRAIPALKHLLITLGGVDRDNVTGEILATLMDCSLPSDCKITVVMGPHAPWLESVRQLADTLPWRTDVLDNVSDMARLMADSDLAIGAAGVTAWERCCLCLPSVVIAIAENQRSGATALQQSGAARVIKSREAIASVLPELITHMVDSETVLKMQYACYQTADGRGVARVVDELVACNA